MLKRSNGFMFYGKMGVDFFSTSELLNPKMKRKLPLIRTTPKFYMFSENPKISLRLADCPLYTHIIALKDDYHKRRMDILQKLL